MGRTGDDCVSCCSSTLTIERPTTVAMKNHSGARMAISRPIAECANAVHKIAVRQRRMSVLCIRETSFTWVQ